MKDWTIASANAGAGRGHALPPRKSWTLQGCYSMRTVHLVIVPSVAESLLLLLEACANADMPS